LLWHAYMACLERSANANTRTLLCVYSKQSSRSRKNGTELMLGKKMHKSWSSSSAHVEIVGNIWFSLVNLIRFRLFKSQDLISKWTNNTKIIKCTRVNRIFVYMQCRPISSILGYTFWAFKIYFCHNTH